MPFTLSLVRDRVELLNFKAAFEGMIICIF